MTVFDVLHRNTDCHSSKMIEASAGTGKTFSIENLFVRLLIEKQPLSLQEILVMTFTRAGVKDLKIRIRANIEKVIFDLTEKNSSLDYLRAIIEDGGPAIASAITYLKRAISVFDEAEIFTIHSFCARMLKEYLPERLALDGYNPDSSDHVKIDQMIVKDFLRSKLATANYGEIPLKLLFAQFKNNDEKLINKLVALMQKADKIKNVSSYKDKMQHCFIALEKIRKAYSLSSAIIFEEFINYAPLFEKTCDIKRNLKPEILDNAKRFSELFDRDLREEDFYFLIENCPLALFKEGVLKKSASKPNFSPGFSALLEEIAPIIERCLNINYTLAQMVQECLQMRNKLILDNKYQSPDEILRAMNAATSDPDFCKKIQMRYRAVVVDEFQDTDPIQWNIFERCFIENGPWCHLVGDPKQSIYAFRKADIYTYLQAASLLGSENKVSLKTNFRSQPKLVVALNELFSHAQWMELPKLNSHLPVEGVFFNPNRVKKVFNDNRGSIHFFIAEGEEGRKTKIPSEDMEINQLFPFIANEIKHLVEQSQVKLNEIAILVRDRFQANNLLKYLKESGIASVCKRNVCIAETVAFTSIQRLFEAILNHDSMNSLLLLLTDPLFGWDEKNIIEMREKGEAHIYIAFQRLIEIYTSDEMAKFFQTLLYNTPLLLSPSGPIANRILAQDVSQGYYRDLNEIIELIIEKGVRSAKEVLDFLKELEQNEQMKRSLNDQEEAVSILTLHISKGLEFEVVFALGLINRTTQEEELISQGDYLIPCDRQSSEYFDAQSEKDAEKARQLYVALTRARERLYIPIVTLTDGKEISIGEASPMELFLKAQDKPLNLFLDDIKAKCDITSELIGRTFENMQLIQLKEAPMLKEPEDVAVSYTSSTIYSFTSLSTHHYQPKVETCVSPSLPLGAETGVILHEIFEKLPENLWNLSATNLDYEKFVGAIIAGTKLEPFLSHTIGIIKSTLAAPLKSGFSLSSINFKRRICELEFLLSWTSGVAIERMRQENDFLMGFVDLIFEHEEKFYIVDWKSNHLANYSQESMHEAMSNNDYFLQAQIYKEALKKYLSVIDHRPFEDIFGGSIYFFIRGINGNCGEGIYYV